MYKSSTFGQISKLIDKKLVEKIVNEHNANKHSKGFNCWNHLIALLLGQFMGSKSLRELEIQFNAKKNWHYHAKVGEIRRSTLSDANQKKSSEIFRQIAQEMVKSQNREVKDVVSLIDSSIIRVDGRGSQWTQETQTRHGKGLKLHIQFANKSKNIEFASVTGTNVNDITEAWKIEPKEGKIYVFDKGYCNYNWWHKIDENKAYFVTRIKKNAAYKIIKERPVSKGIRSVVSDCIIELTNKHPRSGSVNLLAGKLLRLIEFRDKRHGNTYFFISNLLDTEADEIADLYKERWQVELLFKWLKQNLKIKKFLGQSENAIKIQIYIAIIAYVLIQVLKKLCKALFARDIDLMVLIKIIIFSTDDLLRLSKRRSSSFTSSIYEVGAL